MGQGASSPISASDFGLGPSHRDRSGRSSVSRSRRHRKHHTKKSRSGNKKSSSSRTRSKSSSSSGRHRGRTHKNNIMRQFRHMFKGNINRRIQNGETVKGFYKVIDDVVMYLGKPIITRGVGANSFKELGNRWAKTTFDVYYDGKKVNNLNSSTVKLLGGKYAGDAFNVYYGDKKTNMSSHGFTYLGNNYAKDNFDTYYRGNKVKNSSFSR